MFKEFKSSLRDKEIALNFQKDLLVKIKPYEILALGIIHSRKTFFEGGENKKRWAKLKVSGHHFFSLIHKYTQESMKWELVGMPGRKFWKQWERNVEEIHNTPHRSPPKEVHFYSNRHTILFSPIKSTFGNFKPLQKTGLFLKNTKTLSTFSHRRRSSSFHLQCFVWTENVTFLQGTLWGNCLFSKEEGEKVKVTSYPPEWQATRVFWKYFQNLHTWIY